MIRQMVVGFADVETAREATRQAAELAARLGAALHVVSAVEDNEMVSLRVGSDLFDLSETERGEGLISDLMSSLGIEVDYTVGIFEGSPAEILVAEAQRLEADLIVVGNVRMQGLGRLLGSVGSHVVHHAPCSVLIVKTV